MCFKSYHKRLLANLITLVIFLFVPNQLFSQNAMGKGAISFQPLGLLQFGPVIRGDLAVGSNTFLIGQFRYLALGLLYQAIETDGFDDEVSFGSISFGGGVVQFIPRSNSPHRFYFGGLVEYAMGGTRGDVGYSDEWEGEDAALIFAANAGYRWRFPSKFFLSLGGYAGIANGIKDEWWYVDEPETKYEDDTETNIFIMLELSLGWEF